MDRDRSLRLFVRTFGREALSLETIDPADKLQGLRLRWLLQEQQNDALIEIEQAKHRHYCALLASTKISIEDWQATQKKALAALDRMTGLLAPWLNASAGKAGDDAAAADSYIRMFGKPGTPEHDAAIAESVRWLKMTPAEQEFHRLKSRMRKYEHGNGPRDAA